MQSKRYTKVQVIRTLKKIETFRYKRFKLVQKKLYSGADVV